MPPSERNISTQTASSMQAAQDDDEIVDKAPSHPVTTTLLIASAVALIMAIGLTASELGRYVNPATRSQLQDFKITAVQYYEQEFEQAEGEGGLAAFAEAGEKADEFGDENERSRCGLGEPKPVQHLFGT